MQIKLHKVCKKFLMYFVKYFPHRKMFQMKTVEVYETYNLFYSIQTFV